MKKRKRSLLTSDQPPKSAVLESTSIDNEQFYKKHIRLGFMTMLLCLWLITFIPINSKTRLMYFVLVFVGTFTNHLGNKVVTWMQQKKSWSLHMIETRVYWFELTRVYLNGVWVCFSQVILGSACQLHIWAIVSMFVSVLRSYVYCRDHVSVVASVVPYVLGVVYGMCLANFETEVILNALSLMLINAVTSIAVVYFMHRFNSIVAESNLKRESDQLKYDLNHELRSPLHAINCTTEMLLSTFTNLTNHDPSPKELATVTNESIDQLRIIHSSSKLLLELVNNILDYSRMEASQNHQLAIMSKPFDLREMLSNASSILLYLAKTKHLSYSVKINKDIPNMLMGDANRIQQVCLNFLSNALKFTDIGSVELIVDRQQSEKEGFEKFTVSVKDTGKGIKQEDFNLLFQRFSQISDETKSKSKNSQSGSGLGLYISRTLIEQMGGRLDVSSKYGEGSTFSFTLELPLAPASEEDDEITVHQRHDYNTVDNYEILFSSQEKLQTNNVQSQSQETHITMVENDPTTRPILIAEDNIINQQVMIKMLNRLGKEVHVTSNGQECLEKYLACPGLYSLVMLDVLMPKLGGIETARQIRSFEEKSNLPSRIPIIILSGMSTSEIATDCEQIGVNEIEMKPMGIKTLEHIIRKYQPS